MRLPRLTPELPGTGGAIKSVPEDFIVEEIPAYPPCGEGEHLYLSVEKRGITTHEMVRRIARALGVPATSIGTAGQKDRHAIARQVISVPAEDPVKAANLVLDGIKVLSAARHRNKLRTGHLRGNRFHIVVRGVSEGAEARARAVLDRLSDLGMPNYFGPQRFGRGDNADRGRALLRGEPLRVDRFERRFLVSAWQSALFNRYLAARADEGLLHRAIVGDVMQRVASGGLFVCAPEELLVAQARIEAREIVPTGPIFGEKMMGPPEDSPAWRRERAILEADGIDPARLGTLGRIGEGTRRAVLVRIERIEVSQEEDRLLLSFALPSGSYATVLLDEVMKPGGEPAPGDGEPEAGDGAGDDGDA